VVHDARCQSVDLPALEAALTADAEAAWQRQPPDAPAIERLRVAVRAHYRCGGCGPAG